ncbi:hypothetical protein OAL09_09170 [Verrucomicrobia bacterium]|nr:hypothetical protein [Verrucomicrobiota bacterium]
MPEIDIKITDKNRFRKGARVILFFCLTLFIGFVLFSFVVFLFLNKYLKSESFKISLQNRINNELEVSSNFDEFRWQGTTVDTDQLKAEGYEGAIFSKLRADGIRARVNIGAVKRRAWEVTGLDINRINVLINSKRLTDEDRNLDDSRDQGLHSQDDGFLKSFLPNKLEVNQIRVGELNFNYFDQDLNLEGRKFSLLSVLGSSSEFYKIKINGGDLWPKGFERLELIDAELRVSSSNLIIDRSDFRLYENSSLSVSGDVAFNQDGRSWNIRSNLRDVPASELLVDDWIKRLKGSIDVDLNLSGTNDDSKVTGKATLREGSLEAMPILDRIDALLGSSKFRKLSFNDFNVSFERPDNETWDIINVYVLTSGTVCLSGKLKYSNGKVTSGVYMIGITPETIKWVPLLKKGIITKVFSYNRDAAFERVFANNLKDVAKPPEGFLWAVANINQDSSDPYTSDLRSQFFEFGGTGLWGDIVGVSQKALEAVKLLSETAKDKGVNIVDVLIPDDVDEGDVFAMANIKRAAQELGISIEIDGILKGLVEDTFELPSKLLNGGQGLLEALLPFGE